MHSDAINYETQDQATGLGEIVKDGEVVERWNESGIIPVYSKLVVLPDDVPEKTAGGILVPRWARDQRQEAAVTGTIVAIGDEAFSFMEKDDATRPGIGDRVCFGRYCGTTQKGRDGKLYKLMNDEDVTAVLDFAFDAKAYDY